MYQKPKKLFTREWLKERLSVLRRRLKKLFTKEGLLILRERMLKVPRRRLIRLKVKKYFKSHQIRKLQIGTGPFVLEGWFNTDLNPTEEIAFLDAQKPFPFDDCTFDYVFSEHLIEHIEYVENLDMLRECFRILRPGGKIRIATPDIGFLIALYNPEKTELQEREIHRAVDTYMSHIGIYQDVFVINNFFRGHGHKFIYDFKSLQGVMSRAGFVDITRRGVGESDDKNLGGIDSHGKDIGDELNRLQTFVVEGVKPRRRNVVGT